MYKQYTIRKGKNKPSSFGFVLSGKKHKKYNVAFILPEDCWYKVRNGSDDFNRIFGVQFGKGYWELEWIPAYYKTGVIELYALVADGNITDRKLIGEIKINKPYSLMVELDGKKWWFTCLDIGAFVDLPDRDIYTKLQFRKLPRINTKRKEDLTLFVEFNSM